MTAMNIEQLRDRTKRGERFHFLLFWQARRYEIVVAGNLHKFRQNEARSEAP
jgi:hypothetical protein